MKVIVEIKSKQYRVAVNDVIDVDLLNKEPGEQVEFNKVLLFDDGSSIKLGAPTVEGCAVKAELIEATFGEKIQSMKYKRRKSQRTKFGHRQKYSRIKITEIVA